MEEGEIGGWSLLQCNLVDRGLGSNVVIAHYLIEHHVKAQLSSNFFFVVFVVVKLINCVFQF